MLFSRLNFARRAAPHELPERMDQPCTFAEFRACLWDLGRVNRATLAHRPTLRFLAEITARRKASKLITPLRVLDIGSGGGDTLRAVERWARNRHVDVALTGVDLNPFAARAAREFTPADSRIRWVTANALTLELEGGVDVVISSLFTHHLEDAEIVQVLRWMERVTAAGWFVNDLRRTRTAHVLFRAMAATARWHAFVRHDGPISIRRSFRATDWRRLCAEAGVEPRATRLRRWFPFRLCVARVK